MTFDVIDAEKCFSQDLFPYSLIPGEFNVTQPYFHANPNQPKKKRKKSSTTDEGTAKRHEELKPMLTECLNQLETCWKEKVQVDSEKKEMKNEIDFTSIQPMVEAAILKFTKEQELDILDISQQDIYRDLDIFSVFNKICVNDTPQLKLLEISPTATYLIPPRSSFIMGSMTDNSLQQLSEYVSMSNGVDLVVMDPPWPNKSVHRSSKYETQDIYDLFSLPMSDMIKDDTLVAIWVTNKPKFRTFIINKLFPSWQLECVSEWVWLKLTTQGECIFPIDSEHKKPYEQLIIGQRKKMSTIPEKHIIASVPSLRHSRKPPLQDVLSPFLSTKENPVCLEMFARCMTPGWISWGNECLKFQHLDYFQVETS